MYSPGPEARSVLISAITSEYPPPPPSRQQYENFIVVYYTKLADCRNYKVIKRQSIMNLNHRHFLVGQNRNDFLS